MAACDYHCWHGRSNLKKIHALSSAANAIEILFLNLLPIWLFLKRICIQYRPIINIFVKYSLNSNEYVK